MGNNFLKIELTYCRKGGNAEVLNIAPEEYFDPLEEDELMELDSTPKYLEQYKYITEEYKKLSWTILQIYDSSCSKKMISEEKYWGEGNCHRTNIVSFYEKDRKVSCEQTVELYSPENQILHVVKIGEPTVNHVAGIISHTIITGRDEYEDVIIVNTD